MANDNSRGKGFRGLDRRDFMKSGALAAGGVSLGPRVSGASRRPNILFITADDLGWKDLGCYGNPDVQTPHLDRLAGQGVRFTNAFVTAPSCSASRASIITGRASHSVGVHGLTHRHLQYQMNADITTMPDVLKNAGYFTGIHGKWHVAAFKPSALFGYQLQMSIMEIKDTKKAKWFISANQDRPFYLELNFMQTHRLEDGTFKMHPDFPVDPDSITVPDYWCLPNWRSIREDVAKYYSQAARMDHMIGDILSHLDSLGLADNTLVVFVSDNGPPYPGCKTTCYDRGIGTPLILRWPEGLPAGEVRHDLASATDIMPTCLEAAGAAVPPVVQGSSLLPVARGDAPGFRDEVFAEVTYHVLFTPMRTIRTSRYKYIENLNSTPTGLDQNRRFEWAQKVAKLPDQKCCVPRPPEELFDLEKDPYEQENLAKDEEYAGVKKDLVKRLHAWRERTDDPYPDL
ncbi:MAG: sulfatase [bacterium]